MSVDRRVLIVVGVTALLAVGFWFLLLSPKKAEIAELEGQIDQLHTSISASEAEITIGTVAKQTFGTDYAQLVALGKAVPDGDEQAALIYQLNRIGMKNDAFFTSINLQSSGGPVLTAPSATAPTLDSALEPSVDAAPGEESVDAVPTSAPAAPTEAATAALPIGATVGDAGLATLPYQLAFDGNFFKLADFIAEIDGLVSVSDHGTVRVNGRLMTIDGFSLDVDGDRPGRLTGSFVVTTFVTPAQEGLTAGASPAGPGPGEAIPAANVGTAP